MSFYLVYGVLSDEDYPRSRTVKTWADFDTAGAALAAGDDLIERGWADWAHVIDLDTGEVVA